jgi:hypothetical protein
MKLFLTLLLLSHTVLAAEVATLTPSRISKEFFLSLTDDALFIAGEKQFMTHACRFKTTINMATNMRENNLPEVCRAEISKFLLNAGYSALDAQTFIKK